MENYKEMMTHFALRPAPFWTQIKIRTDCQTSISNNDLLHFPPTHQLVDSDTYSRSQTRLKAVWSDNKHSQDHSNHMGAHVTTYIPSYLKHLKKLRTFYEIHNCLYEI